MPPPCWRPWTSPAATLLPLKLPAPALSTSVLAPELVRRTSVQSVLDCGADYGRSDYGHGEKVMVEFVSANPTGPMHMGNARGGAIGDCLASALDCAGYEVTPGVLHQRRRQPDRQVRHVAGGPLPADFTRARTLCPSRRTAITGEDIKDRAQEFADVHGDKYAERPEAGAHARRWSTTPCRKISRGCARDLEKYRINYDVWFPEKQPARERRGQGMWSSC